MLKFQIGRRQLTVPQLLIANQEQFTLAVGKCAFYIERTLVACIFQGVFQSVVVGALRLKASRKRFGKQLHRHHVGIVGNMHRHFTVLLHVLIRIFEAVFSKVASVAHASHNVDIACRNVEDSGI